MRLQLQWMLQEYKTARHLRGHNAGQPKERVSVSEVHDELLHRLHIDLRGTAQGVDPLEQRTELFQVQVQTKSPTSMIHLFFIWNNKNQKVIVLNADPLPMA